jgi:hypothetical protein
MDIKPQAPRPMMKLQTTPTINCMKSEEEWEAQQLSQNINMQFAYFLNIVCQQWMHLEQGFPNNKLL